MENSSQHASREFKKQIRLMGSAFEFVVVAHEEDGEGFLEDAIREVKRIEDLLTEFSETSQTAVLNANAGIRPVRVDKEVHDIIKRCKELSRLTQGSFDITAGVLKKLYNFKGRAFEFPDASRIHETLQRVGYEKIGLGPDQHIFLSAPGMHIGFGAIGKGYAADCVKRLLISKGVKAGVINASGDLTAWGTRADGSPWKIGIASPNDPDTVMAWIPVTNCSVATSGDYEQYFEHHGQRYAHTIDPKTGLPVTGIKSVSIVGPHAELADALATAVTIMGVEVGLHFIEQLPGIHCLIIDQQNVIHTSRHLKLNLNPVVHEKVA